MEELRRKMAELEVAVSPRILNPTFVAVSPLLLHPSFVAVSLFFNASLVCGCVTSSIASLMSALRRVTGAWA